MSNLGYCTAAQVTEWLKQAAVAPLSDTWTDAEIEKRINEAEGFINGKLGNNFTLPFSTVPIEVTDWAKKYAAAIIYSQIYIEQKTEDEGATAPKWRKEVNDEIDEIVKNFKPLHTAAGAVIDIKDDIIATQNVTDGTTPYFGMGADGEYSDKYDGTNDDSGE
jgi:hypothetical protein